MRRYGTGSGVAGLARCTSLVQYMAVEMVEDMDHFAAYGERAQRPQEVLRSRLCDHVYDVDVPMSEHECQQAPAVVVAARSRPVDARRATVTCAATTASSSRVAWRASRASRWRSIRPRRSVGGPNWRSDRRRPSRNRPRRRRKRRTRRCRATSDDLVALLRGEAKADFTDRQHPTLNGRRLSETSAQRLHAALQHGSFPTQQVEVERRTVLGVERWTKRPAWVVGEGRARWTYRGDDVTGSFPIVVLCDTGEMAAAEHVRGRLRLHPGWARFIEWRGDALQLDTAGKILRGS